MTLFRDFLKSFSCNNFAGSSSTEDDLTSRIRAAKRSSYDFRRNSNYQQIISLIDPQLVAEVNQRPSNIEGVRLRCLKAEAFAMLGHVHEALAELDQIESETRKIISTRTLRAKILLHFGRYQDCIDTVDGFHISDTTAKSNAGQYRTLCRLKAEALVTMGRTNDVLGYLRQAMSKVGMTRPDITLIRLSLQDSTQLPEFEKLVAELVASRQITESVGLLENAWACREVENFERAIMFAKSLVLLQATTDYFNVKLGSAEIPNPAGNWIDDAKIALADLKRDLDRFGVEFFLISGTLLGCHREGTLLGHDKDIDVGIMQGPDPAALKRHLTSTGRFRPMPSKEPALIKLRHINDTNIDVFVHWSENDRLIHRGNLVSWWNTPFKLQPVEFLGAPYLVPQEADRYLTENYGNWQVPEPNFDTFIDTPNMIVNEPVALAWFYLIRMYNHARKGNVTKYIAVWRAWQKLGNADLSLSSAVERFLRATETQCEAMLQATRNRAFNDVERIS